MTGKGAPWLLHLRLRWMVSEQSATGIVKSVGVRVSWNLDFSYFFI